MFAGTLTALTRSKRWAASRTPRNEELTNMTGRLRPTSRMVRMVSSTKPSGMLSKRRTMSGAASPQRAAASRPMAVCMRTAVQRQAGSFSGSFLPRASATYLVVVRPRPRSNSPKYPKTTQTRDRMPNRSFPRARTTRGMVTNPTARGRTRPSRFRAVLRKRAL